MTEKSSCIHHWLINSENIGKCKYCSEKKSFLNWNEATIAKSVNSKNKVSIP
jgi:hypothetical protein